MDKWVLGYDCDGKEIEEFRVLRAIWSNDFDIDELDNVDPRQYCAVVADDGKAYAISVYDHYDKDRIRKYENLKEDEDIPRKIKPISEMVNYEVAECYGNNALFYEYKDEIKSELNRLLKEKNTKDKNMKVLACGSFKIFDIKKIMETSELVKVETPNPQYEKLWKESNQRIIANQIQEGKDYIKAKTYIAK